MALLQIVDRGNHIAIAASFNCLNHPASGVRQVAVTTLIHLGIPDKAVEEEVLRLFPAIEEYVANNESAKTWNKLRIIEILELLGKVAQRGSVETIAVARRYLDNEDVLLKRY